MQRKLKVKQKMRTDGGTHRSGLQHIVAEIAQLARRSTGLAKFLRAVNAAGGQLMRQIVSASRLKATDQSLQQNPKMKRAIVSLQRSRR